MSGKLTRVAHTRLAAPAEPWFSPRPVTVTVRSRRGHSHWVTFIDDCPCFPAVYFIAIKSDVFDPEVQGVGRECYQATATAASASFRMIREVNTRRTMNDGHLSFGKLLASAGIRCVHTICPNRLHCRGDNDSPVSSLIVRICFLFP